MRTLVVGDVHGCASELETLVELANPTRLILVGDLFSKGPDALGVWEVICRHSAEAVLGNHDTYMLDCWDDVLAGKGKGPAADAIHLFGGAQQAVRDWLEALPLFLTVGGCMVVHAGLDPQLGVAGTTRKQATTMRKHPAGGPLFWWEQYRGEQLVIYGHDAVRGLQDHRPHSLGLDTGCVYGRALTGFLIEQDEILSVPAEEVWCPI